MTRSSPEEEETTAVSFFLISNPPRRVISSLVLDFGCHSQDLFFTERFLRRILDPFSALMDNAPSNWTFSNDTSPSTSKTDRAVTPRPLILLLTRSKEHPKDGDKTTLLPIGNDMPLKFCSRNCKTRIRRSSPCASVGRRRTSSSRLPDC